MSENTLPRDGEYYWVVQYPDGHLACGYKQSDGSPKLYQSEGRAKCYAHRGKVKRVMLVEG